ncbi:MAG: HesB/IscA family protein [Dictyoglomaceae bacterium]
MIDITDRAVEEFKKFLVENNKEGFGIRIFFAGSSCCGGSYRLGIVEEGEPKDKVVEKNGLKVFIDPIVYEELSEAIIDYNDGFVIETK